MNAAVHRVEGNANAPVLYMALELSTTIWEVVFGDGARRRQVAVPAGELMKRQEAVVEAKQRIGLGSATRVLSCYDAGRDAFWLRRRLIAVDITRNRYGTNICGGQVSMPHRRCACSISQTSWPDYCELHRPAFEAAAPHDATHSADGSECRNDETGIATGRAKAQHTFSAMSGNAESPLIRRQCPQARKEQNRVFYLLAGVAWMSNVYLRRSMMKFSTAVVHLLIVGVLIAFAGSAAAQQAYPNKPIRFIVPYAAGGGTSIMARLIGQKLTESWGQQVLVDSRPGGNSIIGSEALVRSPPDGYTIMLQSNSHAINASLLPLPYDPIKDFAPVATFARSENILVLHPSLPANNLQEFIAFAKSRPGQLNYASSGTGGPHHLASELFSMMAGVKMQHVPYKGAGRVLPDIIGGQVELAFMNLIVIAPHLKTGQLKAIAITGEKRKLALPQTPTFTEAGLPGFEMSNWNGVFAPTHTPKQIIDKLSTEIAKILSVPDFKEKLASLGTEPFISTPEQFAAFVKAEIAKYAKIIKTADIKLKN